MKKKVVAGAILNDGQRIEVLAKDEAAAKSLVASQYPNREVVMWLYALR